jgi:hypothetical protein
VTNAEFWVPVIGLGIAVVIGLILLLALAKREEG